MRPTRAGRRLVTGLVAGLAAGSIAACGGDGAGGGIADPGVSPPARLEIVSGEGQRMLAGRRSTAPLVVRALDELGRPVAGARIRFQLDDPTRGHLSQPEAIAGAGGLAETFVLEARPGDLMVRATAGSGSVDFHAVVDPAPATILFEDETGGTALPGGPHPDSVVRIRVLDTEGEPMAGQQVWFSWPGELAQPADTTDGEGRASTVLRRTFGATIEPRLFAFILDFPEATASTTRRFRRAAARAILVSINGLRADALDRWSPPTLLSLAEEGALIERAETVLPTLTLPAHLSLLGGVSPAGHGIWSDDLEFTPQMASLDPLFRSARSRGRTAYAYMSGEGPLQGFEDVLSCRLAFGLDSLTLVPPSAAAAVEAAGGQLADPGIDLVFLHLPDPDLAGHAFGFDSPEYGAAVLEADRALADILAGARGADSTLVVVTSDHGGGGVYGEFQHGSDSPLDREIPIFLAGGAAIPGARLETASILDVAPTILWALGLPVPGNYEGEILRAAFR